MADPSSQPSPDARRPQTAESLDAEVDRMLMDSFPASDPPQWDSLSRRAAREQASSTRQP